MRGGDCGISTDTPPGLSAGGASSAYAEMLNCAPAKKNEMRRTVAPTWRHLSVNGSCIAMVQGRKTPRRLWRSEGGGDGSDKKIGIARWKSPAGIGGMIHCKGLSP